MNDFKKHIVSAEMQCLTELTFSFKNCTYPYVNLPFRRDDFLPQRKFTLRFDMSNLYKLYLLYVFTGSMLRFLIQVVDVIDLMKLPTITTVYGDCLTKMTVYRLSGTKCIQCLHLTLKITQTSTHNGFLIPDSELQLEKTRMKAYFDKKK